MKKFAISLLIMAALLPSCKKNTTTGTLMQAIVTVKGEEDAECLLQLDEETILKPENISTNPFKKQVRAFALYYDKGETERNDSYTYRTAEVCRLDSILTKKPAANLGEEQNDKVYGTAPVGIYDSWMTVVEDGYITLHFVGIWGRYPILCQHTVNLVDMNTVTSGTTELNFEFRHNYNDDKYAEEGLGYYRNGIVAFDISDILDKINTQTFKINVKFYGLSTATKTVTFDYTRGTSCVLGTNSSESSGLGNYIH